MMDLSKICQRLKLQNTVFNHLISFKMQWRMSFFLYIIDVCRVEKYSHSFLYRLEIK